MADQAKRWRTVFLFLRQGISNRNLLRTDFLKTLKNQPGIRIVIFSPIGDESGFRRELEAENVCVERWPRTKVGFWEKRLKNLKHYVWLVHPRGVTARIKCRTTYGLWGYRWRYLLGSVLSFAGIDAARMSRWDLKIFTAHPSIRAFYDRYQPELVMFTRVFGTNLHVIKEAKMRKIPVVCLVESWDNLTSKGAPTVIPDRLVVWNGINKEEACTIHGFREEDVAIGGIPQFDLYHDTTIFGSREEFFGALGIDPQRRLITYATCTEGNAPEEMDIVESLYHAIQSGAVKKPSHLLIRLHPISSPELIQDYHSRFGAKPGITIQRPGRPSKLHDGWDPTWSDMIELARTLFHGDLLVNIASTITLDAAYLDTPIVCLAFDGERKKDYFQSCRRIYDYACWRNVIETGGVRLAFNLAEALRWMNAYLDDPQLDSSGRRRIRQEQAYYVDSKSGQRMARIVLGQLGLSQKAEAEDPAFLRAGEPDAWSGGREKLGVKEV